MTLESPVPVFRSSGMFRLGRAAAPTGAWPGAAVRGTRTVALPYPEGSDPCLRRYPGA